MSIHEWAATKHADDAARKWSELRRAVEDAVNAFLRMPVTHFKSFTSSGMAEVGGTLNIGGMLLFHDAVAQLPWPIQCRIIADRCGPTQHSIVLMALAWLTYDGWVRYLQEHKHAPVNVQQYLLDGMQADDIRSVLAKEY